MRATQALHLASKGVDRVYSHIDPSLQPRRQISRRDVLRAKIAMLCREVIEYARKNNIKLILKGKEK